MVVDKSVELLEDLVRFLNRKQSFYLKLYDEYVNGDLSDYSHLDDSRKDETDCEGVCEDLVECIKAISNEAQYRGFAKKEKLLCTIDGQDEAMYPFDEWLLKVVRLLDDKTIRLAPVEGEGINGTFYTILFRLTWYVNTLRDLATKTEDEYYGGRRTDVMPYYLGESKLKEDEEKPLRSVRDFIGDYLSKKFTLCPPEVPNKNWSWTAESFVKPGEDACLSCDLIASSDIQKILLDTTTDVVLKPNPTDISGDISIYVKLPDEIVNAIKALPKTYDRWGVDDDPGKSLERLHFKEGYYMYFYMIRTGSHKKECMWNSRPYGIKSQTESYSEDDAIKRIAKEAYGKYSLSDISYTKRPKVEEIGKMYYNYCMQKDFWGTVKDLMFIASDIWVQKIEEKKNEKLKKEQEAKAKKEAEKQSYIDWVEKGNPVYYRYGFAYKGAQARRISAEEALTQICHDKPFEYNWETIYGKKALVLQQYGENDMW